MKFVRCALGLLCFAETALAGGNTLVRPTLAPSGQNSGAEWSFDLNSTYTFGSRIQKAAILQYEEERAGLGISYTLRKGIDFEAVAGWTFQREFDYIRAGPIYCGKGAPYFRLDLNIDLF
jgi:hypothetical protein